MTGAGNWTYLLTGRVPTLIDAGVGQPEHIDAIAALLTTSDRSLEQVIVTHDHRDHASGIDALLERWPHMRCLKHPGSPDVAGGLPWTPISDGQILEAGDTQLVVVHTPGHAPDHVCLWHDPTRTLFGGDLLVEGGTVVVPGGRGGNLREYLASLDRVEALRPATVLPAHGDLISQPAALIAQYRAHRAERERQVLASLAAGVDSVATIVDRVYSDLTLERRLAAAETVTALLEKLRDEGRVVLSHGRVRLVRRSPGGGEGGLIT